MHKFKGSYQVELPGGGLAEFEVNSQGYLRSRGTIEVTGEAVIIRFQEGVNSTDLAKYISITDFNEPMHWDFYISK